MENYMMDSNAPPQCPEKPPYACHFEPGSQGEKSVTVKPDYNRFLSALTMTYFSAGLRLGQVEDILSDLGIPIATGTTPLLVIASLCPKKFGWVPEISEKMGFSFARGTPVIAHRRSGKYLLVIPFMSCHSDSSADEEESASLKQISLFARNDSKEEPVRDRPLLKLRDGSSWITRGAPRWNVRGTPPARGKPEIYWNVIPIITAPISPSVGGSCPAFRQRVSRHVSTRGLKIIKDDRGNNNNSAPQKAAETGVKYCLLPTTILIWGDLIWQNRINEIVI